MDVPAHLSASRRSSLSTTVQPLLLCLRHYRSSRASGVQHPILVSRPSLLHRKR
jgi:hypothetical protein